MNKNRRSRAILAADVMQRAWTPFVLCEQDPRSPAILTVRNSRYLVLIRRVQGREEGADFIHLSVKRLDQRPHIPYRDFMRLKDELCGPEYEGVQLFPARSRETDLANQYHLWVRDDPAYRFPFGFTERLVSDLSIDGIVQEPWPAESRPSDCLSAEQVRALLGQDHPGS